MTQNNKIETVFLEAAIPEDLKQTTRWAPWRAVWNEKRGKWDKVPHRADNPNFGLSTAKPDQWFTFEAAVGALRRNPDKFAGLGYCITNPHGLVMVDLDACVDEDGLPAQWAADIALRLDSYTEISPSGRGLRIILRGAVPFDWNNHDIGIEVYGGHEPRFLTVTGDHLLGSPATINEADAGVMQEIATSYARERKKAEVIDLAMPEVLDELTLPDLDALGLSASARAFLQEGKVDGDRSGALHSAGVSLYALGLDDAVVFSVLATSPHALAVALDHRRQDHDRALLYLWREHCVKARAKGMAAVASADEFEVVEAPKGEWPLPKFKRDKQGEILATVDNVTLAVRRPDVCGMDIRFDLFRDEIMYSAAGLEAWQTFTDADYVRLRIVLERGGFKPIGRELIRDVVLLVAGENVFDTATVWLESLIWDGVPRLDSFLAQFFGAEDTDYTRAVSRYVWTALAGRVMEPGCKTDMVPILVGEQGSGKSTAVAAMAPAPEFFTEISFSEKDEDLARKMRGRLVAEIGELRGLHTREQEAIKAFITRTHENWVPKYREFAVQFPRRLVFIGTTNKDEFLADETGNRRWLPVRVGKVDVKGINEARDQLWAEAREIFTQAGVQYKEAEKLAGGVHQEHMIHDSWQDVVSDWLDTADDLTGEKPLDRYFLRVNDVLIEALGFTERNIARKDEVRVGAILRALGYSRKKVRVDGRTVWAFVPAVPLCSPCVPLV